MSLHKLLSDPRHVQMVTLSALLLLGGFHYSIGLTPQHVAVCLASTLGTQWLCTRILRLPRFEPRSALISGLSLALLIRSNSILALVLAAMLTIGSKFFLRRNQKHIFNPTNFGIVFMLMCSDTVWVSPGQWGTGIFFLAFFTCVGIVTVRRAARSDVTWAFLVFYSGLLFARAMWLGDPAVIPLHQLSNGAFVVFTFFMISDPVTTPNSRSGRIAFAALVAIFAFCIRFWMYEQNALFYALTAICTLTPILDRIFPGEHFTWRTRGRDENNRTQVPLELQESFA